MRQLVQCGAIKPRKDKLRACRVFDDCSLANAFIYQVYGTTLRCTDGEARLAGAGEKRSLGDADPMELEERKKGYCRGSGDSADEDVENSKISLSGQGDTTKFIGTSRMAQTAHAEISRGEGLACGVGC